MSQGRCGICERLPPCHFQHHDTVGPACVPEIGAYFIIFTFHMHADCVCWKVNVSSAFLQGKWETCSTRSRGRGWSFRAFPYRNYAMVKNGCRRVCRFPVWLQKCCRNHYGRDCQGKEGEQVGEGGEANWQISERTHRRKFNFGNVKLHLSIDPAHHLCHFRFL